MYDKIVLTDFCHTIVDYPTCDNFVRYVEKRLNHKSWHMMLNELLRRLLRKTRGMSILQRMTKNYMINKVLYLRQLKGIDQKELERLGHDYYLEQLRPHLIPEVTEYLINLCHEGYKIFVVSSAYDAYVKDLNMDLPIEGILCTELEYDDGKFTGRYIGRDCFGREKYNRVRRLFNLETLKEKNSIGLSDELADYPFLDMCEKSFIVINKGSRIPSWIGGKGYGIIEFSQNGGGICMD